MKSVFGKSNSLLWLPPALDTYLFFHFSTLKPVATLSLSPWQMFRKIPFSSPHPRSDLYLDMPQHFNGIESLLFPPCSKCKDSPPWQLLFPMNCQFAEQSTVWLFPWTRSSWSLQVKRQLLPILVSFIHPTSYHLLFHSYPTLYTSLVF